MSKKNFETSPALGLINVPTGLNTPTAPAVAPQTDAATPQAPSQAPKPSPAPSSSPVRYRMAPEQVKSRRVQIVLQPAAYDKAKAEATLRGLSFNEYIHFLIKHSPQA